MKKSECQALCCPSKAAVAKGEEHIFNLIIKENIYYYILFLRSGLYCWSFGGGGGWWQ